jgi:enoyl-CoA hydratase
MLMAAADMTCETLIVERHGAAGLITLNRPETLNALNDRMLREITQALAGFEADDGIGAVVITGSGRAFAAGADVKEMQDLAFADVYRRGFLDGWDTVARCRKPLIAAVGGFALGGGCELAMLCDIVIAAETARFGQPEITLGIIPGMGGSQRLTRAVGKAKAMDMVLTGRAIDAGEAERLGLVSRVVSSEGLLDEALSIAARIASFSAPSVMMAKEAINRAFETTLEEGLRFERRLLYSLFATEDQKEGMAAFVEKRLPVFRNR